MRLSRFDFLTAAALCLLTWFVFGQLQGFQFINYDDPVYSPDNVHVAQGVTRESVAWAFSADSSRGTANWFPLTWLSLMLDTQSYGADAGGFHRTNVLLHILNVLLLYAAMVLLTGERWKSLLVAALFAVHPFNVETVAWVSERKGLLSTTFGLVSLGAYAGYARRSGACWYLAALVALCFSLMCKQMLVTLPCVFVLLDYWPLRKIPFRPAGLEPTGKEQAGAPSSARESGTAGNRDWRRWVLEKAPFFAVSALFCVVAVEAQRRGGALQSLDTLSLSTRLSNAAVSYLLYVWKMVWPVGLSVHYPHPGASLPAVLVISAVGLLGVTTLVAIRQRTHRPYLIVGWLWFAGMLVPVSGLVQTGMHQMADRYLYFPLIGLFMSLTWFVPSLLSAGSQAARFLPIGSAIIVLVLASVSWVQVGYWENSLVLFEHALEVTQSNTVAHNNLGVALRDRGFTDEAKEHLESALRIEPDYVLAHNNLGLALRDQGEFTKAVEHFEQALKLQPDFAQAHVNLGITLCLNDDRQGGVEQFRRALQIAPEDIRAHVCLAWTLAKLGDVEGARKHEEVVRSLQRDAPVTLKDLPPGAVMPP